MGIFQTLQPGFGIDSGLAGAHLILGIIGNAAFRGRANVRSCDDCPSAQGCAGNNLYPILMQVYDLYAGGMTNKFDILDALDDDSEKLLVRFNNLISPVCWSKAALLATAEAIGRLALDAGGGEDGGGKVEARVRAAIALARDAFENFPWRLSEMVAQAPDLYQAVLDACPDGVFAEQVSKRAFVKICKDIAYGTL